MLIYLHQYLWWLIFMCQLDGINDAHTVGELLCLSVSVRTNMEKMNTGTKELALVHWFIQWNWTQSIHGWMRHNDKGTRICFLFGLSHSYFHTLGYQFSDHRSRRRANPRPHSPSLTFPQATMERATWYQRWNSPKAHFMARSRHWGGTRSQHCPTSRLLASSLTG